jgi:hypothetical protein
VDGAIFYRWRKIGDSSMNAANARATTASRLSGEFRPLSNSASGKDAAKMNAKKNTARGVSTRAAKSSINDLTGKPSGYQHGKTT